MNAQRWRQSAQHGVLEPKGEVQLICFMCLSLNSFPSVCLFVLFYMLAFVFIVVYLITKEGSVALQNIECLFCYPNICQLG